MLETSFWRRSLVSWIFILVIIYLFRYYILHCICILYLLFLEVILEKQVLYFVFWGCLGNSLIYMYVYLYARIGYLRKPSPES
ncbi:uncharacterized protein DS421_20g708730 [Arachis hypogaea]|nr:uncharacterized protein DS421_20g708730 [Arachis hypogaea]